ncbi:nucleotidyltransferase [Lactococcus cremoris]|uniref:nucleotidyltransferase n=1 Tax=Lactococcus lactis subsp. cremoris TaxID=1359 RepID=UPI001E61345C|nr:nucleotidyltransferase [Lactococcus cremoris]MCD6631436.1 nucleotidyltransferase [Lactococcus cremoris]
MTKITGIIAEFNPFHKGHEYLLNQIDGLKIVAMSGNWMQRGEPAIFDKWTRAEMALSCGADLVVELPVTVSVQAADFFASGAVDILQNLGITDLAFGSESAIDYNEIADIYETKETEMESFIKALPDQLSYPKKTQMMWQHFTGIKFDGNTPNHVLALAYAKAAAGKNINLQAIKRVGKFHSTKLTEGFASATALRQQLFSLTDEVGQSLFSLTERQNLLTEQTHQSVSQKPAMLDLSSIKNHVPSVILETYASPKTNWAAYFPLLQYKIRLDDHLENIFQVNQELSVRLKNAVKSAKNFDELVELVYTKRYTKARVRRLLTYILLNIPKEFNLPKEIHILGFSKAGQEILAQNRGKSISKIGQKPWDELTQKADEIYQLGNVDFKEQNFGRKPIIKREK